MQNWDYGWNAPYFITNCTQNRACYFGEIIDGKMELSELGKIAHQYWMELPTHFPFVHLGAFVVMPNHVHGVIVIDKPNDGRNEMYDDKQVGKHNINANNGVDPTENNNIAINDNNIATNIVETGHALSLQIPPFIQIPPIMQVPPFIHTLRVESSPQIIPQSQTIGQKRFQNIGKNSVFSIVGSYKSAVTKHAHRLGFNFAWQTRFHDHIIRNHKSYVRIETYIIENPIKWIDDQFFII
jgi:REP element-mobilizing transposase RayT